MKYPFICKDPTHIYGINYETSEVMCGFYFEVEAPMAEGPSNVVCPFCEKSDYVERLYKSVPVHYNAEGFSKDYFSRSPGRGQPWDKRENLNYNWSKTYGEPPPKADSHGTYDGRPKTRRSNKYA